MAAPMVQKKAVQMADQMEVLQVVYWEPWSVDLMTESMVQLLVVEMVDKQENQMVDLTVVMKVALRVEQLV